MVGEKMRKGKSCLAVFLSVLLVSSFAGFILQVQATTDDWPMFHHDAGHTGTTSAAASGNDTLWQLKIGERVYSSCAVVNGIVYVGSNNGSLYALNAANGAVVWSYNTGGIISSSPTVADGAVYIGTIPNGTASAMFALNAATGQEIWQRAINTAVDTSSPVVVSPSGGTTPFVCAGTTFGNISAWSIADGTKTWTFETGNSSYSSPAVSNGHLYVGSNDGCLYNLDSATGALCWYLQTGGKVVSSPTIANGVLYFGSNDHKLYAVNATADGSELWNFTTGGAIETSPAVADGVVYVSSSDHYVYALNATTGDEIWSFISPYWSPSWQGNVYSSPAIAGGVLYIGSHDGYVFALNATNKALIWSYNTTAGIFASPAVAYGVVYIGAYNGNVYAIGSYSGPTPTPTPSPSPSPTHSSSSSSSSSSSHSSSSSSSSSTSTPAPTASPTPTPEQDTIQAQTSSGNNVTLSLGGNITSTQITSAAISTDESAGETTISFTVTGQSGSTGAGNVTVPKSAVPYGTTPTIYIDGNKVEKQGYTQDTNNYYVWYTTHFSSHQVSIVFASPAATQSQDFPLWAIGLIAVLIVAIVGAIVALKRRGKTST